MANALANALWIVFLITPPVLLLAKFIWTAKVPWWSIPLAVASISWGSLVLGEHFALVHESECTAQIVGDTIVGCPIVERWYTYNVELGWLKGLIYLLPWLAVYGCASVIRKRRGRVSGAPPNNSLERTREG
jgi:hypothetical protein